MHMRLVGRATAGAHACSHFQEHCLHSASFRGTVKTGTSWAGEPSSQDSEGVGSGELCGFLGHSSPGLPHLQDGPVWGRGGEGTGEKGQGHWGKTARVSGGLCCMSPPLTLLALGA